MLLSLFSGGLVRAWNWGSVEECILKLKGDQGDATFLLVSNDLVVVLACSEKLFDNYL